MHLQAQRVQELEEKLSKADDTLLLNADQLKRNMARIAELVREVADGRNLAATLRSRIDHTPNSDARW